MEMKINKCTDDSSTNIPLSRRIWRKRTEPFRFGNTVAVSIHNKKTEHIFKFEEQPRQTGLINFLSFAMVCIRKLSVRQTEINVHVVANFGTFYKFVTRWKLFVFLLIRSDFRSL